MGQEGEKKRREGGRCYGRTWKIETRKRQSNERDREHARSRLWVEWRAEAKGGNERRWKNTNSRR
jgi:hypothetical protein